MKRTLLFSIIVLNVIITSCKKGCDCTESWDSNITYVKNDLVNHDGVCWKAEAQGKGIEPGPWFVNGNDIWKECEE